jgi:hypothetical protein
MIRMKRLVAAFALGAGLAAAGVAVAQTQAGSAAPQAASAQPAPPPAQSTPPTIPVDPDAGQATYSSDPPPASSSGIYLPAVILGYARSAAGCVVVGCEDGPRVGGSAGSPSSGPTEPLPVGPGPYTPH